MKPDELKALGNVIDARATTTETVIKAHVNAEIKASEQRLRAEIKASEKRTQAEILVSRAEAKADHLQLAGKIDTLAKNFKRRLEALEEETATADPNKH